MRVDANARAQGVPRESTAIITNMESTDQELRLARLEETLEDILETVEENNKALHAIKRTMRWSFWGKLLIWILVLVLPFIVLGPLLRTLVPGIPGTTQSKSLFGLPSEEQVKALIESYKSGSGASSESSSQ